MHDLADPASTIASVPISMEIWRRKYQFIRDGQPVDQSVADTFARVARVAASAEPGGAEMQDRWAASFQDIMADFTFLPGGRILAGAGTGRDVTLFNCFVLGRIEDDLSAIFEGVREAALTMQAGGGIGHDFSTLRPRGSAVRSVGADASGPVSFMDVWDAMCRTIMSAGQRRGAMMATLRCDHPDIEEFVAAKSDPTRLRNFNLSVLVTDAFIEAVKADAPWPLVFGGKVYRTIAARDLMARIAQANYDYAEPGVVFIDRVNAMNNLAYCESIAATNPCGEQPLPAYGACLLGSINLARLVREPFTASARLDMRRFAGAVTLAVRFLDNMIDVSRYPLAAQEKEAKEKRRIGLGVTGLADALAMLGLGYGEETGRQFAASTMAALQANAYLASSAIALEKGSFPLFDRDRFLAGPNAARLPAEVRAMIAAQGLRNGCLTSIAPTGTISLLAGNVSSGIEPIFEASYRRNIRGPDGQMRSEPVEDYAHALYRSRHGGIAPVGGPQWATAHMLSPEQHLAMQAAVQPFVDSAISKTINCPADITPEAFLSLYLRAYDLGLKGCTTFRPNAVTGSVLIGAAGSPPVAKASSNVDAKPNSVGAAEGCPVCGSPRTKPDGNCRVCLDCERSLCA